jgi:hypothetical protein
MSQIYIRNRYSNSRVLHYDAKTGTHNELAVADLPVGAELRQGYYVEADGKFIGIYASATNPVLFCNKLRINLQELGFRAEVTEGSEGKEFRLFYYSDCLVHAHYVANPPSGNPFWPEDEEFNDFFLWLKNNLNQSRFYKNYTDPRGCP